MMVAAAYYCHRFFGVDFALEGDANLNAYFRLNEGLVRAGHNPYQWGYSDFLPTGLHNPIIAVVSVVVMALVPGLSEIARALYINMLVSWICLWLLSWSVFALLRFCRLSRLAAVLGAVIVSFTGLHLTGVREFDHMYLISFMFVGPALICFLRISRGGPTLGWVASGAMCIGLSLLGGSNVPMFYYVPFFFGFPVMRYLADRQDRLLLRGLTAQSVAGLAGGLLAAPVLLPGIVFLRETNRSGLVFAGGNHPLGSLISLFLRDWWHLGDRHYHERDFFVGLPVLVLAIVGIRQVWHERRDAGGGDAPATLDSESDLQRRLIEYFMIACLVAGVLVAHHSSLPSFVAGPIAWFYELQSIRYPSRFFLLALLPVAYFAARGFDAAVDRVGTWITGVLVALNLLLILFFLVPTWTIELPDTNVAAVVSLAFAFLAVSFLAVRQVVSKGRERRAILVVATLEVAAVFGMHAFGPNQLTMYSPWYLAHNAQAELSPARLSWSQVLGLTHDYARAVERAHRTLFEPPDVLKNPETRTGRIFDVSTLKQRSHYYAPRSGHRFAFDVLDDPASPQRLTQLMQLRPNPILDLAAVCWIMRAIPAHRPFERGRAIVYLDPRSMPVVERRPSCLPEAFLVPGILPVHGDDDVLARMAAMSRDDFLHQIVVNCDEVNCAGLPPAGAWHHPLELNKRYVVRVIAQAPSRMSFEVHSPDPAILFLSTPYHPAWGAREGERPVRVFRANNAFLGAAVGPGTSVVTFELQHTVPELGTLLARATFAALGAALVMVAVKSRRRREHATDPLGAEPDR